MPAAPKNVRNAHTQLIKRAKRRLDRQREALTTAEAAYRQTIRDAFDAGLDVNPIHQAAGISKDRCWQIKRGDRGHGPT